MAVILIVEDEIFTREIADMIIQDWGHSTLLAGDTGEALTLLRSPQHIDALFTDIYLNASVHGGCEIAQAGIKLRPRLRVLYTTGNVLVGAMTERFIDGSHFIPKPYSESQLHDSFNVLLAAA